MRVDLSAQLHCRLLRAVAIDLELDSMGQFRVERLAQQARQLRRRGQRSDRKQPC